MMDNNSNSETVHKKYSPQYLAQWFLWTRCPSFYIHNSHIDAKMSQKLFYRLLGQGALAQRNHYRLSQLFSFPSPKTLDVDKRAWFFITMSNHCLDFLIYITAALELGMRIRTTIAGPEVRYLNQLFGEDVIHFVHARYTAFYTGAARWKDTDVKEIDHHLVSSLGWAILYRAAAALPKDLLPIWLARLPQDIDCSSIEHLTKERAFALCFSIFKEVSEL